jgi:YVTN family beta-propeller protein
MHPTGSVVYALQSAQVVVASTAASAVIDTITGFTSPFGIAAHPAGGKVYVSDILAKDVKVISTGTNSIIDTIFIGGSPALVAFNPSGSRAYVSNVTDASVSVIDTATDLIIGTILAGGGPIGMAFLPDGSTMYVCNSFDDTVSVVDTATNMVVTTIPVGDNPQSADVRSDGSKLYVVNYDSHDVSVIDTATNTMLSAIPVGTSPGPRGRFIANPQSSTATTVLVGTGTMAMSIQSLHGTLDFDPGPFSVFGTAVDIDQAVSGVPMDVSLSLTAGKPYGFDFSFAASSSTLESFSLAGFGQIAMSPSNAHLTIQLQQPAGTVLPNGPIYSLVADLASGTFSGPFVLAATLGANTPAVPGSTVPVTTTAQLCPLGAVMDLPVTVKFTDVTAAGSTTVTGTCRTAASIPPNVDLDAGYLDFFFDVTTTAAFTPPVAICISYPDNDDNGIVDGLVVNELDLTLLHDAGGSGEFLPANNIDIDAENNRICGDVDSLSPFLLAATGIPKGFVPPDSDARTCEHKLLKQSANLLKAIIKCNRKAADAAFQGKTFDAATCETNARSKYDDKTAGLIGCPPCLLANANGVRDATESAAEAMTSGVYCSGTTTLGGDDFGFVPSDDAAAFCASQQGKNAAKLGKKLGKCYRKNVDAAFTSKSFDLDACLADENGAFDTAVGAIAGCPACAIANAAGTRNQIERLSVEMLSDVYCAGTSALP